MIGAQPKAPLPVRGRTVLLVASAGLLLVAAGHGIRMSTLAGIGPDGGHILMNARLVRQGMVPYLDFKVVYGPFLFYLQAAYLSLFGGSRSSLLLQLWTHHVITLLIVLAILRFLLRAPGWVLCLVSASYLMVLPNYEAFYMIVEPTMGIYGWAAIALTVFATRAPDESWREAGSPTRVKGAMLAAAGFLASVSAGVKQSGAVFLLLTLSIPVLMSERFERKMLLSGSIGALLPFVAFFGTHPTTIPTFWNDSVIGIISFAAGKRLELDPLEVRLAAARFSAWIPGMLLIAMFGASISRSVGSRERRLVLVMCLAGLILWLPVFSRPYRHYFVSSVPFALVALGWLCGLPDRSPRVTEAYRLGRQMVVVLIVATLMWRFYLESRAEEQSLRWIRSEEDQVAAWIAGNTSRGERVLIVPNTPQYHYLVGTEDIIDAYEFVQDPNIIWYAAREAAPVFVVHRGDGRYIRYYEQTLRRVGYVPWSLLEGGHSMWNLSGNGSGGSVQLPVLRPYPEWMRGGCG